MEVDAYKFSKSKINEKLAIIAHADEDSLFVDHRTRSFYLNRPVLPWVDRHGVSSQADTLLTYIKKVDEIGFSPSRFRVHQIELDLERMKNLDFNEENDINTVAARLDYNLTKAYLRYVGGQRYGFINPHKVFNSLDCQEDDTTHTHFRQLYDVNTEELGINGYKHLIDLIAEDSVPQLLRNAEPQTEFYKKLKSMLPNSTGYERDRILANMERCRWRQGDYHNNHEKYVLVNIPSYELQAVNKGDLMEMKMVCGSEKTKTPLLNSSIMRMDLNPVWIMPSSIVKKDIAPHAGNSYYFESRNYFIREKKTGKRVDPSLVSYTDLQSGAYNVIQKGGEGNALGRIIFRFKNSFSIYLHDTSTKSTFGRDNRSASHGCIRVEKPYELAEFLLADKDEDTLDKIKYSMEVRTRVEEGEEEDVNIDKSKLIHSLDIKPQVPLFITYYTLFMMPDGSIRRYADVYGYDRVIVDVLQNFR